MQSVGLKLILPLYTFLIARQDRCRTLTRVYEAGKLAFIQNEHYSPIVYRLLSLMELSRLYWAIEWSRGLSWLLCVVGSLHCLPSQLGQAWLLLVWEITLVYQFRERLDRLPR